MNTYRLKSGTNKGNRRIWIEGTRLLDAGLSKGTALFRIMNPNGTMILSTRPMDGAKRHTISGKGTGHPVLDLSGKWVTAFMGDLTHFEVDTYTDAMDRGHHVITLIITPVPH